ncbi:MAG: hypothetical protein Q8K00_21080 [Syntrophales bacterium]|nr:hypothetical protein [Syntrophales bacterium]
MTSKSSPNQSVHLTGVTLHPNQQAYPGQRIMVIGIANYAYLVPYVENEEELFLKTIIPSRKAAQRYLGEKYED